MNRVQDNTKTRNQQLSYTDEITKTFHGLFFTHKTRDHSDQLLIERMLKAKYAKHTSLQNKRREEEACLLLWIARTPMLSAVRTGLLLEKGGILKISGVNQVFPGDRCTSICAGLFFE